MIACVAGRLIPTRAVIGVFDRGCDAPKALTFEVRDLRLLSTQLCRCGRLVPAVFRDDRVDLHRELELRGPFPCVGESQISENISASYQKFSVVDLPALTLKQVLGVLGTVASPSWFVVRRRLFTFTCSRPPNSGRVLLAVLRDPKGEAIHA